MRESMSFGTNAVVCPVKGRRRLVLDGQRLLDGESPLSRKNGSHTNKNSRFPKEGGKAYRLKGRARFKTGKKSRKRG